MADEKKVRVRKPWSLHLNEEAFDFGSLPSGAFEPAGQEEKAGFIPDRPPTSYWKDAWRRFRRNAVAMVALALKVLPSFLLSLDCQLCSPDCPQTYPHH